VIADRAQGGFSWGGRGEEGDWHFYRFTLIDPPPGSSLLAHTQWGDYPTDLDTLILGPGVDTFSAVAPQWFGPYTQNMIGGSVRSGVRPSWNFQTVTGSTEEWIAAPASSGPYVAIQQAVLLGGHQTQVPFTTRLGLAYVEPCPLRIDPLCGVTCTITATFRSSIDLSNSVTTMHAFGWFTPTIYASVAVSQGHSVYHSLVIPSAAYELQATLFNATRAAELDLALFDDTGALVGAWDPLDTSLATIGGPGVDKTLRVKTVGAGQYWLAVSGQQVETGGGTYDLEVVIIPNDTDGGLIARGFSASISAGQPITFTLETTRPFFDGQRGQIVLGPSYLTEALAVPIRVKPLPDVWVETYGPSFAWFGETITYTTLFGNNGPSDAHNVWVIDVPPPDVTVYQPTARHFDVLPAGGHDIWYLTATVNVNAGPPVTLTNKVSISTADFDPLMKNNLSEAGFTTPYRTFLPIMRRD
jgi:uncharacterized repeat protein (TIGR01451 family)